MSVQLVDLLREHVGHRTTVVEPNARGLAVKCVDCQRLIDLSSALGLRPTGVRPTSTSQPPTPDDPNACPQHPGQWARSCGPCRSELLERTEPPSPPPGTPMPADFRERVQAARTKGTP